MKTAHGKFVAFTDKGKVEPDRDSVGPGKRSRSTGSTDGERETRDVPVDVIH